jgi:hypothetical protein
MIILLVFTAGCEEDDNGTPPVMHQSWIESETDEFIFQLSYGEIDLDDYKVVADDGNSTYTLKTEDDRNPKAGYQTSFKDPNGLWDPLSGVEYNIKIVKRADNSVLWENDIIAN